ncbi:MAG: GNAT family N-acetyltransferase [Bacteroidota bacterium]
MNTLSLSSNWQVRWYPEISAGIEHWGRLTNPDNLFLSKEYFELLDGLDLGAVDTGFAVFEHPQHDTFGIVLQVFSFNPQEQMGKLDQNEEYGVFQSFIGRVKDTLARTLRFRILSLGQLLLTGDHACRGVSSLSTEELTALLAEGAEAVAQAWPERLHGIMIKDMPLADNPKDHRFHALPVQPNMVLDLQSSWSSFEDYLQAMSSKYRVRVRRARKKGKTLERREMDLTEIEARQEQMFAYYQQIASQSDFNAVVLPQNYFTNWKQKFPDHFRVWGYFLGEELIGFATGVYNHHELEAHFLGFDAAYNRSHQLYLNILYDLVEEGISAGVEEVTFSRTALEIKSSVGAEARELYCWMRARVAIANPLVPIVARFIAPLPKWEARHPFKAN